MKILISSMPATGHVNPMLAIARILMTGGHEVAVYTGSAFRARVEAAGAEFFSLPPEADFDPADPFARVPELKVMSPGPRFAARRHGAPFSSTIFRLNTRACKGFCIALLPGRHYRRRHVSLACCRCCSEVPLSGHPSFSAAPRSCTGRAKTSAPLFLEACRRRQRPNNAPSTCSRRTGLSQGLLIGL